VNLASTGSLKDLAIENAYGLDMSGENIYSFPWPKDVHLILGEEGQGLPETLRVKRLKIPMSGKVESLNATVAASIVETPATSKVVGLNGYALSPVEKTDAGSWFWAWSFAMPATSEKKDAAATFLKWATSKEYIKLVGETLSWTQVPPGSRTSTYEIPEYMEAVASFGPQTLEALSTLNIIDPGVSPRPYVGGGWLALPEGQDIATKFAQEISAALVGSATVDEALEKANAMANQAAKDAGRQK